MKSITNLRARHLAVQFLADCVSQCEADGFQQYEEAAWQEHEPTMSNLAATAFVINIGGYPVKFKAEVPPSNPRTT